jgi:hypothetical protein
LPWSRLQERWHLLATSGFAPKSRRQHVTKSFRARVNEFLEGNSVFRRGSETFEVEGSFAFDMMGGTGLDLGP